jgi:pyruvate-formate lyase-activating enzyme
MEDKYVALNFPPSYSFLDYPNPTHWSLVLYLIGCNFCCPKCHNLKLQNIEESDKSTLLIHTNTLLRYIEENLRKEIPDSVVLSGGDPLFDNNLYFTKTFCETFGKKVNICIYTGYDINFVKENEITGFNYIKCGAYVEDLKQETFKTDYEMQLASSNQNFYDSNYKQISDNGLLKF